MIPYLKGQGVKSTDPGALERFEHGIKIATWINGSLLVLIMATIIGVCVFVALLIANRHRPDHFTAKLLMKAPVFSSYIRNVSLQDTCKLMGRLLRGKVPLAEAIDIITQSTYVPSNRAYWLSCKDRIMAGVGPSRALARWPLLKAETDQIATIQSVDQLSEVYESIAEERGLMAKADQRRITMLGIIAMIFFAGATILTMIYLLMVQNQTFLDSMNSMRSGGGS